MENIITIAGSLASIGGAIWAFIEAKKSSKSASKAEDLHNELVHRRKIVEVSQVHSDTKRILLVVSKVGPSCNAQLLKGVNCAEIAKEVEVYVSSIIEQSNHFPNPFKNKVNDLSKTLRESIEGLSEASEFVEKKRYGKNIYYHILDFISVTKGLSDKKREQITNY